MSPGALQGTKNMVKSRGRSWYHRCTLSSSSRCGLVVSCPSRSGPGEGKAWVSFLPRQTGRVGKVVPGAEPLVRRSAACAKNCWSVCLRWEGFSGPGGGVEREALLGAGSPVCSPGECPDPRPASLVGVAGALLLTMGSQRSRLANPCRLVSRVLGSQPAPGEPFISFSSSRSLLKPYFSQHLCPPGVGMQSPPLGRPKLTLPRGWSCLHLGPQEALPFLPALHPVFVAVTAALRPSVRPSPGRHRGVAHSAEEQFVWTCDFFGALGIQSLLC